MLYYVYNNDVGDNKDVSRMFKGRGNFAQISFNEGATWETITTVMAEESERFRAPFWVRNTSSNTNEHWLGHSVGTNWPTEVGHTYLAVCDVCNAGIAVNNSSFIAVVPSGSLDYGSPSFSGAANQTAYTRVWRTFVHSDSNTYKGRFFIDTYPTATGQTVLLKIKNWRQFDVTGWTNAQIQALATKENYDEVYLTLPSTFKGQSNMTANKFLEMGGIIRNTDVDGEDYYHNFAYNWVDLG